MKGKLEQTWRTSKYWGFTKKQLWKSNCTEHFFHCMPRQDLQALPLSSFTKYIKFQTNQVGYSSTLLRPALAASEDSARAAVIDNSSNLPTGFSLILGKLGLIWLGPEHILYFFKCQWIWERTILAYQYSWLDGKEKIICFIITELKSWRD